MCDSARSLALRAFDLSGHGYVQVSCAQVSALCEERQSLVNSWISSTQTAKENPSMRISSPKRLSSSMTRRTPCPSWKERAGNGLRGSSL